MQLIMGYGVVLLSFLCVFFFVFFQRSVTLLFGLYLLVFVFPRRADSHCLALLCAHLTSFGELQAASHIIWPALHRPLSARLRAAPALCHSSLHIAGDHGGSDVSSGFEFMGCYDSWLKINFWWFGSNKKFNCLLQNHIGFHSWATQKPPRGWKANAANEKGWLIFQPH